MDNAFPQCASVTTVEYNDNDVVEEEPERHREHQHIVVEANGGRMSSETNKPVIRQFIMNVSNTGIGKLMDL